MPRTPARTFTKRTIDSLVSSDSRGAWYADRELRGFNVRVYPDGSKTFFVRFTAPGGVRKTVIVGRYGALTLEQARAKARELLADVALGGDPAADRDRVRKMPSWSEWAGLYLERIKGRRKRVRDDVRYLALCSERWGTRPLDTIAREDAEALLQHVKRNGAMTEARLREETPRPGPHPTAANRWLQAVRPCFAEAVRFGLITVNPADSLKRFLENPPRSRVLSDDELHSLLASVDEEPDPHARAAIRLLVETGARVSEVLRAKWEDVDLDAGTWRIPSPKAGYPQGIPLARQTVSMLRRLPRVGSYIVAGRTSDRPRYDIKALWARVVERAGLKETHVHDVRRTFGYHVAKTAGLHVASKLLRHGDPRITARVYAQLSTEDLRPAVERRVLPFKSAM